MKLLNFEKRSDAVFVEAESLDELWRQAEQYGEVSLGRKMFSDGLYEAGINFRRRSGTFVMAKGVNSDRQTAMKMAMQEAISLGAEPSA